VRRDNINLGAQQDLPARRDRYHAERLRAADRRVAFYENTYQWTDTLRSVAGIREDFFYARVNSDFEPKLRTTDAHITSPEAEPHLRAVREDRVLPHNWGQGFHSNDARGTHHHRGPGPITWPSVQKVPALVKSKGEEIRDPHEAIPKPPVVSVALEAHARLRVVVRRDAGTTVASRPSLRRGIEWSRTRYIPKPLADRGPGPLALARRVHRQRSGGQPHSRCDRAGRVVRRDARRISAPWSASLFMRYFGPHPLTEDNSQVRTPRSSGRAAPRTRSIRAPRSTWTSLNLFDRRVNDIEYYYTSRLQGEPAAGVTITTSTRPSRARSGCRW